ncbi:MAG: anthranilate synthase component I [SAR202 cluster bacterium]|mgnify:CR=1 FL=1|nr:anthranilate synthase component I [Chloroflexota bacterium]MQG38659.1 anthranilate synthase component I [SAR202 cluster bacterium]|tara:strand:- start:201 stop:1688 length:1488 start_codon:yes stop_codon:yes gene_type:complete
MGNTFESDELNGFYPTLPEFKGLKNLGNAALVYKEINADLETPVSVYLKVARPPYSFLLESVEGGDKIARYSFIGTDPYDVVKTGLNENGGSVDPLDYIRQKLSQTKIVPDPKLPKFNGGAVGFIGYDVIKHFENIPEHKKGSLDIPESVFMFSDTILVFDHVEHKILILSLAKFGDDIDGSYMQAVKKIQDIVNRLDSQIDSKHRIQGIKNSSSTSQLNTNTNMTKDEYSNSINKIIEYIKAGDCIQVVFSQRFSIDTTSEPFTIYRALRRINPSPYMFYLHLDDFQLIGCSPEMLIKCIDGELDYHPIAGTRPRNSDPELDDKAEIELMNSEKEKAEHIMLVDLGRNDIGKVSDPGTVKVSQLMEVERYSHVMHIVSHVKGTLKKGLDCFDALRSCFPAGTVSGAPKIRAMEIIAELEPENRGAYAGAVGYFSYSGDMDTAILLRTIVLKDGVGYVQAGGGIVADSNIDEEYQETIGKSKAMIEAIKAAGNSN